MSMAIMVPEKPGIYSITNTITGKVLYGSTVNLFQRLNDHRTALIYRHRRANKSLRQDFDKFGMSAFILDVVIEFDGPELELAQIEIDLINKAHQSGPGCYNRKNSSYRKNTIKRTCKICGRPHYGNGYCETHWAALRYKQKKADRTDAIRKASAEARQRLEAEKQ